VCEGVASKQEQLKYKEASGPHGWRAAKNRQDLLSEQQLHLEKQERPQEDRNRVRCLGNLVSKYAFGPRTQHSRSAFGANLSRQFGCPLHVTECM
jgi:hypothetical protein